MVNNEVLVFGLPGRFVAIPILLIITGYPRSTLAVGRFTCILLDYTNLFLDHGGIPLPYAIVLQVRYKVVHLFMWKK